MVSKRVGIGASPHLKLDLWADVRRKNPRGLHRWVSKQKSSLFFCIRLQSPGRPGGPEVIGQCGGQRWLHLLADNLAVAVPQRLHAPGTLSVADSILLRVPVAHRAQVVALD